MKRLNPGQGLGLRFAHLRSTATKLSTTTHGRVRHLHSCQLERIFTCTTRESTGTALTVEQFKYGKVKVTPATVATTGGGVAVAAVMLPTTAAENRMYLARAAAWTYLVASCTDKAYALFERCEGIRTWHGPYSILQDIYETYCQYEEADR